MPDFSGALAEERHGVLIALDVTAGSKGDMFPAGYNEWRRSIGCRVSAPAVDGKANKAVLQIIAKTLGVPHALVSIHSGATSTQKQVLVAGARKEEILVKLHSSVL
jgi:uncharacterized protein (TIGR00251 family)